MARGLFASLRNCAKMFVLMSGSRASYFAIFSDIHGNIDAISAVLADADRFSLRVMLCLGDIVGYGPEPAMCVELVMDTCAITVLGNHESMLFLSEEILEKDVENSVGMPVRLAKNQLSKVQSDWLRKRPLTVVACSITLSHASLANPRNFPYILTTQEATAHFLIQGTYISFNGHTHVPEIWEENAKSGSLASYKPSENAVRLDHQNRYSVNVGSVGQPRDSDPRACYALYDFEQHILIHRRVPYDIDRALARYKAAGLPARNAERLLDGE